MAGELGISWYEEDAGGGKVRWMLDCKFIGAGFACKMEISKEAWDKIEGMSRSRFRSAFAHLFASILKRTGGGLTDANIRMCMPLALRGALR